MPDHKHDDKKDHKKNDEPDNKHDGNDGSAIAASSSDAVR